MKKILFLISFYLLSSCNHNVIPTIYVPLDTTIIIQQGKDGKDGINGKDGVDGKDGISIQGVKGDKGDKPIVGIDYSLPKDGKDGTNGKDGITTIINSGNIGAAEQLFSIKSIVDFGAIPNVNFIDNSVAINNCLDFCHKNNIRTVFFPLGKWNITHPILIFEPNEYSTINLVGESSFWDSNIGSEIIYTGTQNFAIGIQNGKGVKIHGLSIRGQFTPPSSSDRQKFMATTFENFIDGICRDSRYSPYVGIVIDPFTNLTTDGIPEDGGYPDLQNYYGASNSFFSTTGSTGTEIEECEINNFVVGICSSPNGVTRNAEITIINKVQFENCKLCISGGQDQEKGNVISNIYCWGGTHTIFATGLYGSLRMAGNWNIDHANIAGAVVRFIYNDQGGYFPTYISHVFAEGLGEFGFFGSLLACEVSDSHFDFELPNTGGVNRILINGWGDNVLFRSCNFRYYGADGIQINFAWLHTTPIFEHCYFSGPVKNSSAPQ